ncbi:MAG: choice-of-anchor D domain-containing protein, partial [Chitinispirillaceae bacterium]|nr:choice-of-anchor D domain-containing protein [Chitinispirillaceae bacterium]
TSNSWGGGGYDQALYDVIAQAGLFVAAAGNEYSDIDQWESYPAGYDLDNIVSVAATDHNDALADFSNWGLTSVDLGAPGVDILSTIPGNIHEMHSGTSMAAPHVSGCAALLASYNPSLTTAELKRAIMEGVDPIASLEGKCVTGGRLNLAKALEAVNPPWLTVAPATPGTIPPGSEQLFTVTADPQGLVAGTWVAEVIYQTDDPYEPDHILTVTAEIAPCRSLQSGIPSLVFTTVWATRDTVADVVLVNECNAPVTVSAVTFSEGPFTSELPVPFTVRPFGSISMPVRFAPRTAGDFESTMSIVSDAEDNPQLTVGLSGTSVAPPNITVTPASIDRVLAYGTTETLPVTLANTGGADFHFTTKIIPPRRTTTAPHSGLSDAVLFAAIDTAIWKIDPVTGDYIGDPISKPSPSSGPEGLAFDGEKLYYVFSSPEVIIIDPETGEFIDTLSCNIGKGYVDGLGVTADYIILGDLATEMVWICDKATGEPLASWSSPMYNGGLGASESRQSVFIFNWYDGTMEERSILDGSVINSFPFYSPGTGVAYSEGANVLFVASPWDNIVAINPDNGSIVAELPILDVWALASDEVGLNTKWLQASVTEGVVPHGQAITFTTMLSSDGELPETFSAILQLRHARPIAPGPYDIPCAMTVLPEKRCAATPSPLAFDGTWLGRTDTLPLYVFNSGNEATTVSSITSGSGQFMPFIALPLVVEPFDTVIVPVGFTPRRTGTENGVLTILSDAAIAPEVSVPLAGTAVNPPRISYSPSDIARTMLPGKTHSASIQLRNSGGTDFRFNVDIKAASGGSAGTSVFYGIGMKEFYTIDPNTGSILTADPLGYPANSVTYDGEMLYLIDSNRRTILVMNPVSKTVDRVIDLSDYEFDYISEIAVNDQYVFGIVHAKPDVMVVFVNKETGELSSYWGIDAATEGICNGRDDGTVIVFNSATGNLETRLIPNGDLLNEARPPVAIPYLGFSKGLDAVVMSDGWGHYFVDPATGALKGGFTTDVYIKLATDEIGRITWLSADNASGIVPVRDRATVSLTFNTDRMLPGTYTANVSIAHEKGWEPGPFVIPCQVMVLPIKKLAVSPGSTDFGNVWIGGDSASPVILTNSGNVTTTVHSIITTNGVFSFEQAPPFTVAPFSSLNVPVHFRPQRAGSFRNISFIISDAIDLPILMERMNGTGITPPAITIAPDHLTVQLPAGGSSSETLSLHNSGQGAYDFRISVIDNTPRTVATKGVLFIGTIEGIRQLDPETFEPIGSPIAVDGSLEGLAFDGKYLYAPLQTGRQADIVIIDPDNPDVRDTLTTDMSNVFIAGLGVTDEYLLVLDMMNESVRLIEKQSGTTIRTFDATYCYGALTAAVERNSYYIFNYMNWTIQERDLSDGSVKNELPVPVDLDFPAGAGYSQGGHVLYLSGDYGRVVAVNPDDGRVTTSVQTPYESTYSLAADEAGTYSRWLSVSITNGTVTPGGSLDIGVQFNAEGLRPGEFNGEITIIPEAGNAPGPFTIPCTLSVNEGEAALKLFEK